MLTIAYLGPEHTNTHLAALARFGRRSRYVHAPTLEAVFQLVERRAATFGVVPVENSLQGAVTHTLDHFIQYHRSPARIYGEIEQPIRHHLVTLVRPTPRNLRALRGVRSHPQALAQCGEWVKKHLPNAQWLESDSTTQAVFDLMTFGGAAIGTKEIARQFNLSAIPIPLSRHNTTRFLVIALTKALRGRRSKTSVLFALKDRPGALHDALVPFKEYRINLTKIESRPSKRKAWEYLFFIDLEGYESEPRVKRALAALKRSTSFLRILGSYPTAR